MDLSVLDRSCRSGQLVGGGPTGGSGGPPQYWGINLNLGFVPIYANLVRGLTYFSPAGSPGVEQNVPLDQYFCPTTDFSLFLNVAEGRTGPGGDSYPIRFVGRADLQAYYYATVTGQSYDAAANVTTAMLNVVADPARFNGIPLIFTNTRRLPADTTSTGIDARTLTIMRPIAPGSSTAHDPSEQFNRQLKVACKPWSGAYGYFRDLDLAVINGVANMPAQTPANRTMPFNPLQFQQGVNGRGLSIEDRIALANFLGCGWWNTFPDMGTTDLFQTTLNIIKFGSDAAGKPYTAAGGSNPVPTSGPAHAPLGGIFLWEQSNETWNPAFAYGSDGAQIGRYGTRGTANYASLNANGEVTGPAGSTSLDPKYCQLASDLLANADLAKATLPGGLNVKYFPILSSQTGNGSTLIPPLTWMQRRLALRNETVAQNIAAGGGASYESMVVNPVSAGATADSVFAAGVDFQCGPALDALGLAQFGLPGAAYEGGLCVGDDNDCPLTKQVNHDARLAPLVESRELYDVACGVRFITTFSMIAGEWSLVDSIWDLTHPKWLGHAAAIAHFPCDGSAGVVDAAVRPAFADPGFNGLAIGSAFAIAPSGSAWSFVPNGGITEQTGGFCGPSQPIPSGPLCGFIQYGGSISQSVAGWGSGSYRITGYMNGRLTNGSNPPFRVLVDGVAVGSFTPTPQNAFQQFGTAPFTPGPGTHTVAFGLAAGADLSVLLDGLTIVPVAAGTPAVTKLRNGRAAGLYEARGAPAA